MGWQWLEFDGWHLWTRRIILAKGDVVLANFSSVPVEQSWALKIRFQLKVWFIFYLANSLASGSCRRNLSKSSCSSGICSVLWNEHQCSEGKSLMKNHSLCKESHPHEQHSRVLESYKDFDHALDHRKRSQLLQWIKDSSRKIEFSDHLTGLGAYMWNISCVNEHLIICNWSCAYLLNIRSWWPTRFC